MAAEERTTQAVGDDDDRAVPRASVISRWLAQSGTWVLLLDIALVVVFTFLSPGHVFWSIQNFKALMLDGTETLLLALGVGVFLGAGAVDLSVGANLVLSSVIGTRVLLSMLGSPNINGDYSNVFLPIVTSLVVCIAAGALYGVFNGVVIAYMNVNSLIATLGTLGIGTGIALLLTGGNDLGGLPSQMQSNFGLATFGSVPSPALLALAVALCLWWMIRYTRFGVRTLAIGSLRLAAERSGIRVRRHLLTLAVVTGSLAGLAGFVDLSHYGATTVSGHANDSLAAVTAVVIGGTRLEGGKISIPGIIWGTALSVILQGGLVVIGVQSFWQLIVVGAVLIAAVFLDRLRTYGRNSRH